METNEHILNRADMINMIAKKINAKSYLEIGVQTGKTYRAVEVRDKTGVDPDPIWKDPTHLMTSDQFFDQIDGDYDIIFVDGLHHSEQVYKDIENAITRLRDGGVILVDDVAPLKRSWQTREPSDVHWCGDVWRGWLETRIDNMEEFYTRTYNVAFGIGIMTKEQGKNKGVSQSLEYIMRMKNNVCFEDFKDNQKELLDFRSVENFISEWS